MFRKKIAAVSVSISVLMAVVLSGCSQQTEPDIAKTGNINRSSAAANSNFNGVSNMPNSPSPNVNNAAAPIVNNAQKTMPAVKEPTPRIGSGGGDLALLTQVRSALSADKELINAVIVEIKEGNATLTGKVSSEAQKTKAGQIVQSVAGIRSVKNNLSVSS